MKKNIIASILEAVGTNILSLAMKLSFSGSIYVWRVYIITILIAFIGFLLFNIGIDVSFKRKISTS